MCVALEDIECLFLDWVCSLPCKEKSDFDVGFTREEYENGVGQISDLSGCFSQVAKARVLLRRQSELLSGLQVAS